jgi:hypothetical protein
LGLGGLSSTTTFEEGGRGAAGRGEIGLGVPRGDPGTVVSSSIAPCCGSGMETSCGAWMRAERARVPLASNLIVIILEEICTISGGSFNLIPRLIYCGITSFY